MASPFIAWLDEAGAEGRELIGGKGASLATMHAAGFPVPPGFVVTADGYRRFIAANGISAFDLDPEQMRDVAAASTLSASVCGELSRCQLPDDLRLAILEAVERLGAQAPDAVYAVRSSALSEDGSAASFAGLYESYLNARDGESVLGYVHSCFVSLWSGRAIHYRAIKGLDQGREAMGVVVMEMVQSESSGVAFTVNPVTGDEDQVVINSSWGLGEAVVAGIVTPDMFVVGKRNLELISRDIYAKDVAMVPDPDGDSKTIEIAVEEPRASAPSISDEQAIAVATLARDVEEHYGRPQDVEWAIAAGHLSLLQARPITTL